MDSQTSLLDMGVLSDGQLISEQSTQEITFSNLPSIPNGNAVAVLLEIKHQRTGQLHFDSVSNVTVGEVYELDLSEFGTPIELTAYLDLNGSASIERCDYPPQNGQIVSDRTHDLWMGDIAIDGYLDDPMEIVLEKESCGAGTPQTRWNGIIDIEQLPQGEESALFVELSSIHREDAPNFRTLIEMDPAQANENRELEIQVTGLLPGMHQLKVFLDSDQDKTFSPCLPEQVGGGDLMFSETIQFEIELNQSLQSANRLILSNSGCPVEGNELTGMLDLSALGDASQLELSGNLLMEIWETETRSRVYSRQVEQITTELIPFTITNLPDLSLDFTIYLDRDGDENLLSCASEPDGQDLFSSSTRSFQLQPQENKSIGTIQLESHNCAVDRLSKVSVTIEIEPVGARKESPRPIYAVIQNEETGETERLLVASDHLGMESGMQIERILAPGNYSMFAFVDSEADDVFSHCEFDAFGDRAVSALYAFSLSAYELFEAPSLRLERLGCDFPTVQFNLNLGIEERPQSIASMKVIINLQEQGGLTEQFIFDVPPVEPPWFFPITDLVPGTYDVVVFLDEDLDGTLGSCEDGSSGEFTGQLNFSLDRMNPIEEAQLALTTPCDLIE